MRRFPLALLALLLTPAVAGAQPSPTGAVRKQAGAQRIGGTSIRLDGRLDEAVWRQATPLADFIQKEPNEGTAPVERMEVRFVYDDTALYVGARMWSANPPGIQAPLGRRDSGDQAERIFIALDTFLDHRTAYSFGLTASGVRTDGFAPNDDRGSEDDGFDPVWEGRAVIDGTGWSAELWIPFSQLRFNEGSSQVWGLNVGRFVPARNEEDYWVPIPRTEVAWASRFGELRGLEGIQRRRRLEVVPYASAGATLTGDRDHANPFDDGRNLVGRAGADLKMGLGSNLTIDMTVNPDFGQVEADPAEVNLSAYETVFPEKRPFFTEGASLMNLVVSGGQNLFNSRRIGARPLGPASGLYVDYPQTSTILAAGKITGRTPGGMSIGALSAVTADETARFVTEANGPIRRGQVAPFTTYAVGRVQQEFGRAGSTASVMGTVMRRNLDAADPLAALLARTALGFGSDAVVRFKGGEYELTLLGMVTHVAGETAAIERLQRTSAHYFQRPDREHSRLDATRTSLGGVKGIVGIERRSGRHWLWDMGSRLISPGMEANDLGRVNSGDGINHTASLRYRETRPGRVLRNYSVGVNTSSEWDYDHDLIGRSVRASTSGSFRNFWSASAAVTRNYRAFDLVLTRGGPLMERPAGWSTTASLGSASTAQTKWSTSTTLSSNEDGGHVHRVSGSFSFRPGPRWQLSIDPALDHTVDAQQYVTRVSGGGAATYGNRYVFAYIDRSTVSAPIRLAFTVKPDVNLDVYAEPFASSGRYYDLGELMRASGRERLVYGTSGTTLGLEANGDRIIASPDGGFTIKNPDFHVRSMRSNVVLRWEWRPGSTFYVVWQQDREARTTGIDRAGFGDAFRSLGSPGTNVFSVKTSFWMPR